MQYTLLSIYMQVHIMLTMEHVDETTVDVWVNLVKAHRGAFAGVEMTLKAADCPPLEWYDALLELRRAPEGLRLQALEARMLLAQYNVSRLADRL